ncbi:transmembrane protein [Perilla frutescens var. frutescens]|nr:transmembrane protein [Perilla frutescens var. frutescens]
MDGLQQMGLPIVGIVAAAALTFYAISFAELREKSFRDLEEREDSDENGGFKSSLSSRQRRARRKAEKQSKS